VTETENLEQLILTSRNRFRTLVDGLADQVISIDRNFTIQMANRAVAEIGGLHPREVIGRQCYEYIYGFSSPCPENGRECPALLAQKTHQLSIVKHSIESDDPAEPNQIEIRAMPVDDGQNQTEDIVLLRRDVTLEDRAIRLIEEQKAELERVVQIRTRELVQANEELKRLQELKDDLTNMVIHDLKGPLSEIKANLEMVASLDIPDLAREMIDGAGMGSADLERMITNLLDISRMEENRLKLEPETFFLEEELDRAVVRFSRQADLTSVTLEKRIAPNLPAITADRRLIERVWANLISNALDYTPEGGRVGLGAEFTDQTFRFEVSDTGRGIPADLQELIFQKFSQGKQKDRPKTSSGLGLAFCKMAVEAHGGRIWVESREGEGSRFLFTIPAPGAAPRTRGSQRRVELDLDSDFDEEP
jgi:signal transduction histidine kinase